jgi:hypothetical protein
MSCHEAQLSTGGGGSDLESRIVRIRLETPKAQRDPVMFFWPSGFLEAWGTKANKPHFLQEHTVCFALPKTNIF